MVTEPAPFYGLPAQVQFCRRCVISNQRPNSAVEFKHTRDSQKSTIGFDAEGVCDACRVGGAEANDDRLDASGNGPCARCATGTAAATGTTTAWCPARAARTASTPPTSSSTSTGCTR